MKLFWKISISIFFSFLITISLISYVISTKQIAGEEKRIVEINKLFASFFSKEIEVGYYESKWPFESLKKLSEHKETLFWWIVRDDGTIHLADNASFMGTYAQDYFPQVFNLLGKKDVFLNRDQNYGVFFTPFKTGTKNWSFWYGFSMSQVAQRKKEIIFLVTVTSISALFVLSVILYFAIKYFTKPIEELTYSAEVVGRGNLDHRVNINSKDELGQLAQSFNKMTEDLHQTTVSKEVLMESEDRYRDLVEFSEYLICTHDLEGKILSVNQGASKLLGYEQSDIINKNLLDFLAPEIRGEFDHYLDTILKEGSSRGMMLVQTASGEKRIWEYNNSLRTEGVTEPIVRSMAHDITDLKRMEKEREKLILQLQKALAEVKQLSGLLPICSSCKKIRDDKGYWNQIETYIHDHSEAEFSHGICPECFKKLYPDY